MKKYLLIAVLLLTAGYVHAVQNDFKVPVSVNNISDPDKRSAGVDVAFLVTSTTPVLATDNAGTTVTQGLIYWVVSPSSPSCSSNAYYLEVRSTNTANVAAAKLFPRISAVGNAAALGTSQIMYFDPPVPFTNGGLSLAIGPASGTIAAQSGCDFAVGITWLKQ